MTSSRSKVKGTGFETQCLRALGYEGLVRTPPGAKWDLELPGDDPIEVLATRPDYGSTLVTLRLVSFMALFDAYLEKHKNPGLRVECKRFKAFAHHKIYDEKFRHSPGPS